MARRRTARQAAASRRNLEIARKKRKRRRIVAATGVALGTGALVARHQMSGSKVTFSKGPNISTATGTPLGRGVVRHGMHGATLKTKKHKRTIKYEHRKLEGKVLGNKIAGAPKQVTKYAPISTRRLKQHNVPMSEEAKAQAARKYLHTGDIGRKQRAARIDEGEVMRRTQSYMNSFSPRRQTSRRRDKATAYYRQQPRYTGKGTPGRRGRARSRELRNRKKSDS